MWLQKIRNASSVYKRKSTRKIRLSDLIQSPDSSDDLQSLSLRRSYRVALEDRDWTPDESSSSEKKEKKEVGGDESGDLEKSVEEKEKKEKETEKEEEEEGKEKEKREKEGKEGGILQFPSPLSSGTLTEKYNLVTPDLLKRGGEEETQNTTKTENHVDGFTSF